MYWKRLSFFEETSRFTCNLCGELSPRFLENSAEGPGHWGRNDSVLHLQGMNFVQMNKNVVVRVRVLPPVF